MKILYYIYQICIALPILLVLTILTAIVTIVGSLLGGAHFWGYYPGKIWSQLICLFLLIPVKIHGREKLHDKTSYIFVPNHQGSFDIFLIYGFIGRNFKWMMKKSLRKLPFVGKACESAGHIFVDRSGPKKVLETIRQAKDSLKDGVSLVVFPEGARTFTGHMGYFKKGAFPDSLMIDSLLQITGYEKVKLENGEVIKQDPRIMLSCSAVAKGYSVDVVARLLDRKDIKNYMVDIGGEVVEGKNPSNNLWRIGINKPVDDSLAVNQDLQTILEISDLGLATSGNYRNYYYKDGKKYAHTIDPRTGYPVQHSILSSTVIAKDCMTADALATAFMVMGLEKAETFCKANPEIDAYFIYSGENGEFKTYYTEGMKKYIAK
jgi:1-acyl-sn-glycerol-3-phosphate acyltransferase